MPGRTDRGQAARPRLVPQASGYAVYVDQQPATGGRPRAEAQHGAGPQRRPGRVRHARRRSGGDAGARGGRQRRAGRQRSIRSTLVLLLILPLISLIALWAYAASTTLGDALAKRAADSINHEVGAPIEALVVQLQVERSQTFGWQSTTPRPPRKALDAQRALTDQAVAAIRVGAAAIAGQVSATDRSAAATVLATMGQLGAVRARVDTGTVTPLAAFQFYNAAMDAIYPFVTAMFNPQAALPWYQVNQAAMLSGQAVDDISQEAALVGGGLAAGGKMPAALYQQFTVTVDNQRLEQHLGSRPVYWQLSPDPYLPVFNSPAFASLQKMENQVVAAGPGARLPFAPQAWQGAIQSVFAKATAAGYALQADSTTVQAHDGDMILLRLIVIGGVGFLIVVVTSFLLLRFGNRIRRELTALRGAARALAAERLPGVVSRLRAGADVDVAAEAPPLDLGTRTREVTETADAFSVVQLTAVEAAVQQAQLRKGVSLVFRSLARRNQSLLQRQLQMLDEMERHTDDADALAQLFRLDHLTTRMRRQAEGLIILSGASPGRVWRDPVPVIEVMRGAIGEIEGYERVDLIAEPRDFVLGTAVADLIHMLAELVENAVQFSPPGTRVQVCGGRVANGYSIEVEDRGVGIPLVTMSVFNERLASPPEFDLADSDQLGLFVVSRLAARHRVMVSLRRSGFGGTTAIVLLPHALAIAEEDLPPGEPRGDAYAVAGARPALTGSARAPGGAARGLDAPARAAAGTARAAAGAAHAPVIRESAAEVLAGRRVPRNWGGLSPAPLARDAARPADDLLRPPPTEWTAPTEDRTAPAEDGSAAAKDGSLPRRQAGASLAPELRERYVPGAEPAPPAPARRPDQARALMSAVQLGWRAGREADLPADGDDGHRGPAGRDE